MSCCYDTDELVGVIRSDRPGYLLDKLVGGTNITLSLTGIVGSQTITIDGPIIHDPVVVTSDDASVTVVYDAPTSTYDLSVNCCDQEDKFVAVGVGCDPDYLENVLIAEPGGPITITKVGCDLEVGFNAAVLPDLDKKVAVNAGCTSDYLDAILVDGFGTIATVDLCTMKYDIDETWEKFQRPWGSITLEENNFYDAATSGDFDTLVIGLTDTYGSDTGMHVNANALTITKAGPYRVSFTGKVEINDHIVAFRVALRSSRAEYHGVIDHKYGAGSTNGGILTTGPGLSLYSGGMIRSVGQSVVLDLEVGDTIGLSLKVDASVSAFASPQSPTGQIRLVGNVGSIFTPQVIGGRIGLTLTANYVGNSVS